MKKNRFFTDITLILITILLLSILFMKNHFGEIDFEQLLFHMFVPIKGNSGNFLTHGIEFVIKNLLIFILMYFSISTYF